jgi:copper transport protein
VRRPVAVLALVCAGALLAPAQAFAHAALLHTVPSASVRVLSSPKKVQLTYSEAVEPRFATILVEDASGRLVTRGVPERAPGDPHTLTIALDPLPRGWYLVYWRVISQDGHPVRGAFTFSRGPNEGPAPQFPLPPLSESAATPSLVVLRWIAFLGTMVAVGLLAFRALAIRPLAVRLGITRARRSTVALAVALGVALVATPVYVLLATAEFAQRPWTSVGALVPLMRVSSFGRALLDLELLLGLFALCCACVVATERLARKERTVAELLALAGASLTAAALLVVPALAGHAATTSPRGVAVPLDWLHLVTGSVWIGGLVGLLVLWSSVEQARRTALLGAVVPRFSRIAFGCVVLLTASGTVAALLHLPTLATLWTTSYGQTIVLKVALLLLALLLAAVNLVRTKPRLEAAAARKDETLGAATALLLRRLVRGEVAIVTAAILAAALLTSLPPPAKALASLGGVSARVGPGAVQRTISHGSYRVALRMTPNKAAVPNEFELRLTQNGRPLRGAHVVAQFAMLDMDMQALAYLLPERAPGTYAASKPALVMVGHWAVRFSIAPARGAAFTVTVVDTARG